MTRPLITTYLFVISITLLSIYQAWPLLVTLLIPGMITLVSNIVFDSDHNIIAGNLYYPGRMKKIYTQYGRFYVRSHKGFVHLYKDNIFYMKHIDYNAFSDIDGMKSWIKLRYDSIYKIKKKHDNVYDKLKSWNGHIDVQTERDEKLKKLV